MHFFTTLPPVMQAFYATLFTWFVTALGAAMVFFFKKINNKVLSLMLGFAAGVMTAASFWSLLAPAIELCEAANQISFLVVSVGFLVGGLFLFMIDKLLPNMCPESKIMSLSGGNHKNFLLILAITLHNIPEGLAVGVAFGALAIGAPGATLAAALSLAIGIGIQNFPEGAAVSIPLNEGKMTRFKCFMMGQFSGMVEPIAGVLGAALVIVMRPILPFALAFAAGAMIFVVAKELIPSANKLHVNIGTAGVMLGFVVMMVLDVALG